MTQTFGVAMDDELGEYIDNELQYGDSRSEWIRAACGIRRGVETVTEEYEIEFDSEKDMEMFVKAAVREKLRDEFEGDE